MARGLPASKLLFRMLQFDASANTEEFQIDGAERTRFSANALLAALMLWSAMDRKIESEGQDGPEKEKSSRKEQSDGEAGETSELHASDRSFESETEERLEVASSSIPTKNYNESYNHREPGSRGRGSVDRKESLTRAPGSDAIVPGAVAVPCSQSSSEDDEGNGPEPAAASSGSIYMVHATPVEEIVATEVVAEERAHSIVSRAPNSHAVEAERSEGGEVNGTKERHALPDQLNVEEVKFDEQANDEEVGQDVSATSQGEASKSFESKPYHFVLVIIIIVVYLLATAFAIFGLAVKEDDAADDGEDPCRATKALVFNNLQVLKGFALCAYVFGTSQLFVMVFEWLRHEQLSQGTAMVIPFLCSRSSVLKQVENPLTAVVFLLLHLFWFLFVVAMRVCFGVEGLGRFREDILDDCPDLGKTDVPTLSGLSAIISVQMALLLYLVAVGIARVFFLKKDDDAAPCTDRQKIRAVLQFWLVELIVYTLASVSVYAFIRPTIADVEKL